MCFTPGSEPARSSSTPSKAASPSRVACGLHIRVQPAGAPPVPQDAGGGGAGAPCGPGDADRPADADALGDGPADPDGPSEPAGLPDGGPAQVPAAGDPAPPPKPPSSATIETTALAARHTARAGTPTRRNIRGTVRYPTTRTAAR